MKATRLPPSKTIAAAICLLAAFAAGANGQAQISPARAGDLPIRMRSLHGVRLNRDSLLSSQKRLGATENWGTGQGDDARTWWCYRFTGGPRPALLLFSSDGEMGGPGREIDEMELTR